MVEIIVRIPENVDLDPSELARGIEEFVKLKIARDRLLKRLNGMLKDSKLTEDECVELGR